MTNEAFVAEMKGLLAKLDAGQAATTAAAAGGGAAAAGTSAGGSAVEAEQKGVTPNEQRIQTIDTLRKSFEELGAMHPGYAKLGTDAVLANPYDYLSEKRADGQYKVPNGQLGGMISSLLQKNAGKGGTPVSDWMRGSGRANAIEQAFEQAIQGKSFDSALVGVLEKALTTGGGSGGPMIRTDLEPLLREAYLRNFPALANIRAIPANGLVHTYNVRTGHGEASTVSELGDLTATEADSTFVRKANSNIAVIANKRGISLKLQYATAQSGMGYDLTGPDNLEVAAAFTAIAKKNQALFFQGNYSTAAKTLNDEEGLYDANAFDGLRTILKAAGTSITKSGGDTHIDTINTAIAQLANAGADVLSMLIFLTYGARIQVNKEFQQVLRVVDGAPGAGFASNLSANGLLTVADVLQRFQNIPSNTQNSGIGYYNLPGPIATEDLYVVDTSGMAMAYLGSPSPVILELPVGYNNALSNVYIAFLMNGLVVFIENFQRKIRIGKTTV